MELSVQPFRDHSLRRVTGVARVAAGLLCILLAPQRATAQAARLGHPYPANDSPLSLPSGTVVRQRALVVFRGHDASTLTITIETPTAARDTGRVAHEAREVATLHDTFARSKGISRITVAVCRTRACFELREPALEMFNFARGRDGSWQADRSHAP